MKDRSCCCPQLPISLPALTALLQFPSIMQLSRIANLRSEARECHWWNPLAGGLEVRRNKNWVSPTCISVYPSSSIVIHSPTSLHWIYTEWISSSLSLSHSSISAGRSAWQDCVGPSICLPGPPSVLQSQTPADVRADNRKKWGKKENLAAILPDVNPCANIIEAHNRIFLPKLTARVWNLSKYVLTFSPGRPTGPNWWPLAFHSNHLVEANC